MPDLTIRDIAKMAGVSPTVVSFVINGKDGVNDKTRQKVLEIVKNTNYRPNINSLRLVRRKSFNIGIAIKSSTSSPFSNLFYFEIAQGLLEKSKRYGYNIVFTDMENEEMPDAVPDIVRRGDVDGMILFQSVDASVLNALEQRSLPTVLIDFQGQTDRFISINADYATCAATATKHLIDKGHREIAMISSNFASAFFQQVFTGFSKAAMSAHIHTPLNWICVANSENEVCDVMESLIASGDLPTAIFCSTDMIALTAMRYAKTRGIDVPGEMSFIGIDNILLARFTEPSLTSIHIDKYMMGIMAMEQLMMIINGEAAESMLVASDVLIERNSVATRAFV